MNNNTGLFKKQEKSLIHNLNLNIKEIEKEQSLKPAEKKGNLKITPEINDIEIYKNSRTGLESRRWFFEKN